MNRLICNKNNVRIVLQHTGIVIRRRFFCTLALCLFYFLVLVACEQTGKPQYIEILIPHARAIESFYCNNSVAIGEFFDQRVDKVVGKFDHTTAPALSRQQCRSTWVAPENLTDSFRDSLRMDLVSLGCSVVDREAQLRITAEIFHLYADSEGGWFEVSYQATAKVRFVITRNADGETVLSEIVPGASAVIESGGCFPKETYEEVVGLALRNVLDNLTSSAAFRKALEGI